MNEHKCRECRCFLNDNNCIQSFLKRGNWICRLCNNAYKRKRYVETLTISRTQQRIRRIRFRERNPEKCREDRRKYYLTHSEEIKSYVRKYRENNKKIHNAQEKARYALKHGILIQQPCAVCQNPKVDKHHHDYDRPLDVQWLCAKHHKRLHIDTKIEVKP